MPDSPVYLYILMRADRPDMNPGKAVAQGSHAANQCIAEGRAWVAENALHEDKAVRDRALALEAMINEWESETGRGFGTCVVLSVTEAQMRTRVAEARAAGHHAGITHDPSYPLATPPRKDHGLSLVGYFFLLAFGYAVFGYLDFALVSGVLGWLFHAIILAVVAQGDIERQRNPKPATIPLDTCAYIFGRKDDLRPFVGDLPLMA